MKKSHFFLPYFALTNLVLGLVFLICTGCGNGSVKLSASESSAFDSAPADLKQQWEKALAADKLNDYATAQTLLDGLLQVQLNDDQKQALNKERDGFSQRLLAAADKNNPAAIKAIQDSQKSRSRTRAQPAP